MNLSRPKLDIGIHYFEMESATCTMKQRMVLGHPVLRGHELEGACLNAADHLPVNTPCFLHVYRTVTTMHLIYGEILVSCKDTRILIENSKNSELLNFHRKGKRSFFSRLC